MGLLKTIFDISVKKTLAIFSLIFFFLFLYTSIYLINNRSMCENNQEPQNIESPNNAYGNFKPIETSQKKASPILQEINFDPSMGIFDNIDQYHPYSQSVIEHFDSRNTSLRCSPVYEVEGYDQGFPASYATTATGKNAEILENQTMVNFINAVNEYLYRRVENKKRYTPILSIRYCEVVKPETLNTKVPDSEVFFLYDTRPIGGGAGNTTYLHFPYKDFPSIEINSMVAYGQCKLLFVDMSNDIYFKCSGSDTTSEISIKKTNLYEDGPKDIQSCSLSRDKIDCN